MKKDQFMQKLLLQPQVPFNSNSFSVFTERFKFISESHALNTKSCIKGLLFVKSNNNSRFCYPKMEVLTK